MKKMGLILSAGALWALVLSGCIMTATGVITVRLAPDDYGNPVTVTEADYSEGEIEVNLSEDEDFAEFREKIKDIDNVGFYLEVTNNLGTDATFQLFLEPDTSKNWTDPAYVVDSGAYLVFTGLTIPGGESVTIDWNASMAYINNLAEVKPYLESGLFSLYPLAVPHDDFNLTTDSLVIIVTLTGTD